MNNKITNHKFVVNVTEESSDVPLDWLVANNTEAVIPNFRAIWLNIVLVAKMCGHLRSNCGVFKLNQLFLVKATPAEV